MREMKEINENYLYLILVIPTILYFMPAIYIKELSIYLHQFSSSTGMIGFGLMCLFSMITLIIYLTIVKKNNKRDIRHLKNVKTNEAFILVFGLLFSITTGPVIAVMTAI